MRPKNHILDAQISQERGIFLGGGQKTQPIMKYRAYLALGKVIRQLAAVMWSFAASTAVTGCCYQ